MNFRMAETDANFTGVLYVGMPQIADLNTAHTEAAAAPVFGITHEGRARNRQPQRLEGLCNTLGKAEQTEAKKPTAPSNPVGPASDTFPRMDQPGAMEGSKP